MGTLVFWHNFGDHAGEKPEAILRRKREEIARNTWTLWSFRHRKDNFVKSWVDVIKGSKQERVLVLCSASKKVFFPKIEDEEKILQLENMERPAFDCKGCHRSLRFMTGQHRAA